MVDILCDVDRADIGTLLEVMGFPRRVPQIKNRIAPYGDQCVYNGKVITDRIKSLTEVFTFKNAHFKEVGLVRNEENFPLLIYGQFACEINAYAVFKNGLYFYFKRPDGERKIKLTTGRDCPYAKIYAIYFCGPRHFSLPVANKKRTLEDLVQQNRELQLELETRTSIDEDTRAKIKGLEEDREELIEDLKADQDKALLELRRQLEADKQQALERLRGELEADKEQALEELRGQLRTLAELCEQAKQLDADKEKLLKSILELRGQLEADKEKALLELRGQLEADKEQALVELRGQLEAHVKEQEFKAAVEIELLKGDEKKLRKENEELKRKYESLQLKMEGQKAFMIAAAEDADQTPSKRARGSTTA